jgi:predicted transposase YdaD
MTRRCVCYDLFQRMERKQPFRIILLDEVNNIREEQIKVPNCDITWTR